MLKELMDIKKNLACLDAGLKDNAIKEQKILENIKNDINNILKNLHNSYVFACSKQQIIEDFESLGCKIDDKLLQDFLCYMIDEGEDYICEEYFNCIRCFMERQKKVQ